MMIAGVKAIPVVARYKVTLETGRVVYVYGAMPKTTLDGFLIKDVESAGYYDRSKNHVHMTEPVTVQDGRKAPGA